MEKYLLHKSEDLWAIHGSSKQQTFPQPLLMKEKSKHFSLNICVKTKRVATDLAADKAQTLEIMLCDENHLKH